MTHRGLLELFKGFLAAAVSVAMLQAYPVCAEVIDGAAARFLLVGPGARAAAMGKAFTALPDDVNAVYWNPAGMARIRNTQVQFMHGEWFGGIDYDYLAYVYEPQLLGGNLGANFTLVDYGTINVTKISGEDAVMNFGTTSARDVAVGVAYGRPSEWVDYGLTLKYVDERIEDVRASAPAVDLGVIFHDLPVPDLRLGMTVLNIGPRLTYIQESEKLPLTFKAGLGYIHPSRRFSLGFDVAVPNDGKTTFALGMEYKPIDVLALRLGYNSENEAGNGISGGFGFDFNRGFTIDYAYVPFGDLGNTHRLSVDYTIGYLEKQEEEPRRPVRRPVEPRIVAPPPPTADDYLAEGNRYYQAGNYIAARTNYLQALETDPGNRTALEYLAITHYQLNDYSGSRNYFQQLLDKEPENLEAHLYLGLCYEKLGLLTLAIQEWETVLDLDPGNEDASRLLNYYRPQIAPPPIAPVPPAAPAAIEPPPPSADDYLAEGNRYYQEGDYRAARNSYLQALELAPDDPAIIEYIAITSYKMNAYGDALEYFQRVTAVDAHNADAHLYMGICYEKQGDEAAAIAEWRRTLELDPANASARQLLDYHEAQAAPAAPAPETPEVVAPAMTVDNYVAEGNRYYQAGNFGAARASYLKALELEPGDRRALENLAITYYQLQDYEQAREQFAQLAALAPDNASAHLYLGICLEKLGMVELAVAEWRTASQLDPTNAKVKALLDYYELQLAPPESSEPEAPAPLEPTEEDYRSAADGFYREGNYQAARDNYLRALELAPDDAGLMERVARCYYQLQDYSNASGYFEPVTRLAPDNADAHLLLGNCFEKLGLLESAVESWRRVLELEPGNSNARMLLDHYEPQLEEPEIEAPAPTAADYLADGNEYYFAGDYRTAQERYLHALELAPEDLTALEYVAITYYQLEEYGMAREYLQRLVAREPDNVNVHLYLGVCFEKLGQLETAVAEWRRAEQLEPGNRTVQALLGYYEPQLTPPAPPPEPEKTLEDYLTEGDRQYRGADYAAARASYERALELASDDPAILEKAANSCYRNGEYRDALDYYNQVLSYQPRNSDAHFSLGVCYQQLDMIDWALAEWDIVLGLDPEHAEARALVERYRPPAPEPEPVAPPEPSAPAAPTLEDYLADGNSQYAAGRYQDAVVNYLQVLELDPDNRAALAAVSRAYFEMEDYRNAVKKLSRLIKLDPHNVAGHLYLGRCYAEMGSVDWALEEWRIVTSLDPDQPDAQRLLEQYQPEPVAEEEAAPEPVAEEEAAPAPVGEEEAVPATAAERTAAGNGYFQAEDYYAAIANYEQALAMTPDDRRLLENLAIAHYRVEEYVAASQYYNRLLALEPRNAIAYLYLGVCLEELGRTEDAVEAWQRARALDPENGYVQMLLEQHLPQSPENQPPEEPVTGYVGDHGDAIEPYEEATLPVAPVSADDMSEGDWHFRSGDYRAAIDSYQAVLHQEPENSMAASKLGQAYYLLGEYREAAKYFGRALNLDHDSTIDHIYLGRCYERLGNVAMAISSWQRAQEIEPNNLQLRQLLQQYGAASQPETEPTPPEAPAAAEHGDAEFQQYFEAGVASFNGGSYQEARSYLEAAVALNPEDVAAHYYLSDTYYALGETEAALAEIEKARELLQ